jgi:hypothetical protein
VLIGLEGAHVSYVSIFGEVEHLRAGAEAIVIRCLVADGPSDEGAFAAMPHQSHSARERKVQGQWGH